MAGSLIVTAEFPDRDFAWLDQLRRTHYPPERNRTPAHLTICHSLPPSAEGELRTRLAGYAKGSAPRASIQGVMDLGGAVALRVVSEDLDRIRTDLAFDLHGLLGRKDLGGWNPHVTIQNKVAPSVSRALITSLERQFEPRSFSIRGLGLYRYLNGPWEKVAIYPFRGP